MGRLGHACERARVWISLELDDELAEVEAGLLARHLTSCETCVAYRGQVAGFTTELRVAPALAHTSNVVTIGRRSRRLPVRKLVHLSAAAAVIATIGGTVGHSLAKPETRRVPGPVVTVITVRNQPGVGSQAPVTAAQRALPLGQRNAAADF
ncbi:MAG: hypothetical protein U0R50_12435 [Gaiellales bacterium]